jgi:hypothetical protein
MQRVHEVKVIQYTLFYTICLQYTLAVHCHPFKTPGFNSRGLKTEGLWNLFFQRFSRAGIILEGENLQDILHKKQIFFTVEIFRNCPESHSTYWTLK